MGRKWWQLANGTLLLGNKSWGLSNLLTSPERGGSKGGLPAVKGAVPTPMWEPSWQRGAWAGRTRCRLLSSTVKKWGVICKDWAQPPSHYLVQITAAPMKPCSKSSQDLAKASPPPSPHTHPAPPVGLFQQRHILWSSGLFFLFQNHCVALKRWIRKRMQLRQS